jgi:hypothetical protein
MATAFKISFITVILLRYHFQSNSWFNQAARQYRSFYRQPQQQWSGALALLWSWRPSYLAATVEP